MINIAICDDNKEHRDILCNMCQVYSRMRRISFFYIEFSSGEQVIDYHDNIDILFLDIELSGLNGLKVMESVAEQKNVRRIVFESVHDRYICDVYSSKTRGFLIKPVIYEKFEKCMDKIIKELSKRNMVEFYADGKKFFLNTDEIIYLYSMGNYIKIICADEKEHIIYGTMSDLNEQLKEYGIIRVHKSYIVNLKYIDKWKRILNISKKNIEIPVGKKYYGEGKRRYEDYCIKIMREI